MNVLNSQGILFEKNEYKSHMEYQSAAFNHPSYTIKIN